MMKKMYVGFLTLAWGIQLSALSGCAVASENISKKGLVTVERVASQKVAIPWANVYRTDQSLIVHGVVRRRSYSNQPLQVHVDATVLSSDGEVLQEAVSRDVWVPRRSPGKGSGSHAFEIRLPVARAEGGTVRLVCHAGPRDIHL
jgi:hypothetical protein